MLASNICCSSVRNLRHVTLLAPVLLSWQLYFWKICTPLAQTTSKDPSGWIRNDATFIITIVVTGILVRATSHYASRWQRRMLIGGHTANPIIQQGITTFLTTPPPPSTEWNKLRMRVTMTPQRIIARVINHRIATLYNTTKVPAADQIQKQSCTCNYVA